MDKSAAGEPSPLVAEALISKLDIHHHLCPFVLSGIYFSESTEANEESNVESDYQNLRLY